MKRLERHGAIFAGLKHAALIGAVALLAGCSTSSLPDWANPSEWFDDDAEQYAENQTSERPEAVSSGPPSLTSVPERPEPISTPAERQASYNAISSGGYDDTDVYAQPDGVANSRVNGAPSTGVTSSYLSAQVPDISQLPNVTGQPASSLPRRTVNLGSVDLADLPGGTEPAFETSSAAPLSSEVMSYLPRVVIDSQSVRSPAAPAASASTGPAPIYRPQQPIAAAAGGASPVETIYFVNGSSNLNGEDIMKIGGAARRHTADGGRVLIVGHASSRAATANQIEADTVNFEISRKRAQAVANALVQEGVDPALIMVEARGDGEAARVPATAEQEARGRRVEIYID